MSPFARIASQRIYEQIVDQISRMVREGALVPGDRLPPERQLAEEFGVSRTAVREALSALCMAGVLEARQGEGTFVREVTADGLVAPMALLLAAKRDEGAARELLEIRAALEAESAYLAAQRHEVEDLAAMEAAFRDMQADPHGATAADADWRFHYAIAAAAGNGLILQIMRTLQEVMQQSIALYRQRLLETPGMDQVLIGEHSDILEAIRDGRPEAAADRMRAHIKGVRVHLGYGTGGRAS